MGMWPAIMVLRGCGNCLLGVLRGVTFDISVFVQRLVVGRRSDAEAMRFDVSSWQKKKKSMPSLYLGVFQGAQPSVALCILSLH